MPYLANETQLDLEVGDTIKVTILEDDPREDKTIYDFKKGEIFELKIDSISYCEPHKEYRYHYGWGPKGFECIFGMNRAILYTDRLDGWSYTDISIKWEKL